MHTTESPQLDLSSKIQSAWRRRVIGDLPAVRESIVPLVEKLQIKSDGWSKEDNTKLIDRANEDGFELALEVVLLKLSLLRQMDRVGSFHILLDDLFEKIEEINRPKSFWYWHERGLSFYFRGDYSNALDAFNTSLFLASNLEQKLISSVNMVLSCENLGLSYEKYSKQCREYLEVLPDDELTKNNRTILELANQREKFRAGQPVDEFFAPNAYSSHYLFWIQSLPYRSEYKDSLKRSELPQEFYLGSFRLRTLQGLVHPDDRYIAKPSEFVERLYLWTWWLITGCRPMDVSRIATQIEVILEFETDFRCQEDQAQLGNALQWLSLFCPKIDLILSSITRSSRFHECYRVERNITLLWRAILGGDEIVSSDLKRIIYEELKGKAALAKFEFLVPSGNTISFDGAEDLTGLARKLVDLQSVADPRRLLKDSIEVVVDLRVNRVFTKRGVTLSESLATLLSLLNSPNRTVVSLDELMVRCFGIERCVEEHDAKIYNLVARAKKLLPAGEALKIRGGYLHYIDSGKRVIEVLGEESIGQAITLCPIWQRVFSSVTTTKCVTPPTRGSLPLPSLLRELRKMGPEWFSRQEVQTRLGIPRSSINRLLRKLIEKKYIETYGRGKACKYRLKNLESSN